jgi:hypothetical protein
VGVVKNFMYYRLLLCASCCEEFISINSILMVSNWTVSLVM